VCACTTAERLPASGFLSEEELLTTEGIEITVRVPPEMIRDVITRIADALREKQEEPPPPHEHRHDPAGTTACSTERRWSQHMETPASSFGFAR
jgi:hypothetical protein